jgi:hypothetical protein
VKVKRSFATGRMRVMVLTSGMDLNQKAKLWVEPCNYCNKTKKILWLEQTTRTHKKDSKIIKLIIYSP